MLFHPIGLILLIVLLLLIVLEAFKATPIM